MLEFYPRMNVYYDLLASLTMTLNLDNQVSSSSSILEIDFWK